MEMQRCDWAGPDPLYIEYHDKEWGVPVYDDRQLFEMLILEGAQAGLSWFTILKKRPNYRKAFADFDPNIIVRFDTHKINSLLNNPGIVRNRMKVEATVQNARAFLELKDQYGEVSHFLWQFVDGEPITNQWQSLAHVPSKTPRSDSMSKALKKLGFKFVGSTICYAFMQAVGMVNDHTTSCFRHAEITSGKE